MGRSRNHRKSGKSRTRKNSGGSDDQIEQFLAQSDEQFLGGYKPDAIPPPVAGVITSAYGTSGKNYGDPSTTLTPVTITTPGLGSAVGAYIVLYVTRTCGICAYLTQSVMPALLDSYQSSYDTSKSATPHTVPAIVKIAVETVADPTKLPDGVSSLPTFAIYYIDDKGNILTGKPVITKPYIDLYNEATKNIKLLSYPLPYQFAYHTLYDWIPSVYDDYIYTDTLLRNTDSYRFINRLFSWPSYLLI